MNAMRILVVLAAAASVGIAGWRILGAADGDPESQARSPDDPKESGKPPAAGDRSAAGPSGPQAGGRSVEPPARRSKPASIWKLASPPARPAVGAARPMVGPEGLDADGFPKAHPDATALRALLAARRFDELTRHVESFQADFELDFRLERWPIEALSAFAVDDPEVGPLLDAWVKEAPASFAPIAARGIHGVHRGWSARGTDVANETTAEEFAEMHLRFERATPDLREALSRRPRLLAAHIALITMAAASSDEAGGRQAAEAGIAACPECTSVRMTRLHHLTPRWSADPDAMNDFIHAAEPWRAKNARLSVLGGVKAADDCLTLRDAKRLDDALLACNRAVHTGDHAPFLESRARTHIQRNEIDAALADIERALTLDPNRAELHALRADLLARQGRWEEARASLDRAWLLDAHDKMVVQRVDSVVASLHRAANAAAAEADKLVLFGRALDIDADAVGVLRARGALHLAAGRTAEAEKDLDAAHAADPGSFETCRDLDRLRSGRGDFAHILPVWDRFLELEPDDARAFAERSGTLHHLGRDAEARADLHKACVLGFGPACEVESHLR